MANDLYRTYEVLVEESVHPDHPKRAKDRTSKPERFNAELDGALRDTHMIFQDAVCYNTLCIAGLAGNEELPAAPGEKPKPLNPLWKYLTSSAPGGINAETEKMICRLATHYKPLEGVKTAKDFLNRVYSDPLQTHEGMTDAEREAVMLMRAQCYRILEKYGTKQKTNGGLECEDMSAFANTWTGLTSIPGSITVIPGNGGRLRTLLNLIWRLHGDKEKDGKGRYTVNRDHKKMRPVHYRMVMETLARSAFPKRQRQPDEVEDRDDQNLRLKLASQDQWDEWRPLFESKKGKEENDRRQNLEAVALKYAPTKWLELAEAVKEQITDYCEDADSLDKLLVAVIEFCLPLRGRHWSWSYAENKARLSWGKDDEDPAWNPNIQGMRGLSMRRLDQILNLRQRCQSFAKLEDRYHRQFLKNDFNPPDSVPREEIDDVCPLLLERSNRIREQRVNQAAHLILAEALGMELKNPAEVENKNGRKNEVDLHGEYQRRKDKNGKPYPRCSVIVLENLERYRTSQERTRSENSRLMQWAHRAIIEKLEDMCRPFGITLMLVDPAFTSHFDSRNGLPGVRVNQVSRGFHEQYPYAKWINDKTKKGDKTSLALEIENLIADFDAHPNYGGTLVLAVEGGKEFVPVMSPEGGESVVNADITAAANIGLRGVADPQRWDIFPRLRTKQVSDTQVRVTSWRGWFGKLMPEQRMMGKAVAGGVSELPAPAAKTKRKKADSEGAETGDKADSQSGQSSEYPPFFVEHPQHDWLPANDWLKKLALEFVQDGKKLRAYPQGAYLKRVELECTTRIEAINRARIQKSKRGNDDVPM